MITAIYVPLAILYLGLQHRTDRWLVALKAAPILLLAAWTGSADGSLLIVAALLLSAAGDVALGLNSDRYFIQGLGLFLLAHVAYVVYFAGNMGFSAESLSMILLTLIYGAWLIPKLLPQLGKLRIPVLLYMGVIVLMSVTAALQLPFSFMVAIGAFVFMLSDGAIATDKFLRPVPYRDFLVMFSYYLAQYLIVAGVLA